MLKLELDKKKYYDFVLADDDRPFVRNYNDYLLFHIDVTQSLTSVSGTTQPTDVTFKNISLNAYDNGLLNYNLLPEYSGDVVINNPYSYTFKDSSYIHNNDVLFGFDSVTPMLFEMMMPVSQDPNDKLFFSFKDKNNPSFNLIFLLGYIDGINGTITIQGFSSTYSTGDLLSIYLNCNIVYLQVNGITIAKIANSFTNNDYRFAIGSIANSSTSYTVNEFRIYGQKSTYTGTTNNITGLTMPITGITYTNAKTKFKVYPVTGYTKSTKYDIIGGTNYNQLNGGFYQGVFDYYNYPVQYMEGRMNKGWTVNMLLHYPISGYTSGLTLNSIYSGNTGFIYYMGTRSESKYSELTPYEVKLLNNTFNFDFENYPTYFRNITGTTTGVTNGLTYNSLGESNLDLAFEDLVFGDFFDGVVNYGAYYLYYEGNPYFNAYYDFIDGGMDEYGYITGMTNNAVITNGAMLYTDKYYDQQFLFTSGVTFAGRSLALNGQPYTGYFNVASGMTYAGRSYNTSASGLTYYETYKDIINNSFGVRITPDGRIGYRTIYATDPCYTGVTQDVSGITNNSFVDYSEDCQNYTIGKIITKYFTIEESYTKQNILSQYGDSKYVYVTVVFNRDFSYDTECQLEYLTYNNGTLSICINGFKVYENNHVVEPIPHKLDTDYRLQEAVPYNLSFGGGTQGLYDSIFVDTGTTKDGIIQKFFSGTFEGGVTSFEMYSVPLYITETRTIMQNNLQSYNLYYPNGGRRIFIKNSF